jgi:hypothetical protein
MQRRVGQPALIYLKSIFLLTNGITKPHNYFNTQLALKIASCIKLKIIMQGWFMLFATKNYVEANIIKGLLEENHIQDIILNRQDSNYPAVGEIELYVPAYLKDIAVPLLNNTLLN